MNPSSVALGLYPNPRVYILFPEIGKSERGLAVHNPVRQPK